MPAKYDQHFLASEDAADRIVQASGAAPGSVVVEIGPGRGILTGRLLRLGAEVCAVEIDPRLCAGLDGRFRGENLRLVNADWLELDLGSLPSPAVVVSNLPYSMAAPILQRLLDWPGWRTAVLMFQKEVGQRILASPGARNYGLLTLSVALKASAEELFTLGAEAFDPPPKVESMVLRLSRLSEPRLPPGVSEGDFFALAKAAFGQKRKMAAKAISAALGAPRGEVERAFAARGLSAAVRAQELSLEDFAALAKTLRGPTPGSRIAS